VGFYVDMDSLNCRVSTVIIIKYALAVVFTTYCGKYILITCDFTAERTKSV